MKQSTIILQGQPNRRTGSCDGDIFSLLGGPNGEFKLCGQNNGQHSASDGLLMGENAPQTHFECRFSLL